MPQPKGRVLRVYADTSVYGGCFDPPYESASRRLFDEISSGLWRLVVSEVVLRELEAAPSQIRHVFLDLPDRCIERVSLTAEALDLRDEYLAAGALGPRRIEDAAHVALATVGHVDVLASWNFRHMVHLDKIRQFNAVNLRLGFSMIEIRSPQELTHEE